MNDDDFRKAEGRDWIEQGKEFVREADEARKNSKWWQFWKALPTDARFVAGGAILFTVAMMLATCRG